MPPAIRAATAYRESDPQALLRRLSRATESGVFGLNDRASDASSIEDLALYYAQRQEELNAQRYESKNERDRVALEHRSCFIFPAVDPDSESCSVRLKVFELTHHRAFEVLVVILIFTNCIFLALDDPTLSADEKPSYLRDLEYFFTACFATELLLKVYAQGFVFHNGSYLRNGWNVLDFLIVTFSVLALISSFGNYTAMRTLRVLRPLRSINGIEGLKNIVNGLLQSLQKLVNVLALSAIVFSIFGILGVQLWAGKFKYRCELIDPDTWCEMTPGSTWDNLTCCHGLSHPEGTCCVDFALNPSDQGLFDRQDPCRLKDVTQQPDSDCRCRGMNVMYSEATTDFETFCNPSAYSVDVLGEIFGSSCPDGYECVNSGKNPNMGFTSFDHFGWAVLAVFQVLTLEGWVDIMYIVQDVFSDFGVIYFILLVLLGAYFLLNLALAVINEEFDKISRESEEIRLALALYEAEKKELEIRRLLYEAKRQLQDPTATAAEALQSPHSVAQRSSAYEVSPRSASIRLRSVSRSPVNGMGGSLNNSIGLRPPSQGASNGAAAMTTVVLGKSMEALPPAMEPIPPQPDIQIEDDPCCSPSSLTAQHHGGAARRMSAEGGITVTTPPMNGATGPAPNGAGGHGADSGRPSNLRQLSSNTGSKEDDHGLAKSPSTDLLAPNRGVTRKVSQVSFSDPPADVRPVRGGVRRLSDGGAPLESRINVGANCESFGSDDDGGGATHEGDANGCGSGNGVEGNPVKPPTTSGGDDEHAPAFGARNDVLARSVTTVRRLSTPAQGADLVRLASVRSGEFQYSTGAAKVHHNDPRERRSSVEFNFRRLTEQYQNATLHSRSQWVALYWSKARWNCWHIASDRRFTFGIVCFILLNTIIMACEHHGQPDKFTEFSAIMNIILTLIFTIEMILKLMASGFRGYVQDQFNILDGFVVIVSLLEIILGDSSGISVLRALRLLRVLKLLKNFKELRNLVEVILCAVRDTGYLNLIILLYIFCAALVGMQIFGGKFFFPEDCPNYEVLGNLVDCPDARPRATFDSFYRATLTVFQVLTRDDWVNVMWNSMRAVDPLAAAYFLVLVICGDFVILNLFLAILIQSFDQNMRYNITDPNADDEDGSDEESSLEMGEEPPPPEPEQSPAIAPDDKTSVRSGTSTHRSNADATLRKIQGLIDAQNGSLGRQMSLAVFAETHAMPLSPTTQDREARAALLGKLYDKLETMEEENAAIQRSTTTRLEHCTGTSFRATSLSMSNLMSPTSPRKYSAMNRKHSRMRLDASGVQRTPSFRPLHQSRSMRASRVAAADDDDFDMNEMFRGFMDRSPPSSPPPGQPRSPLHLGSKRASRISDTRPHRGHSLVLSVASPSSLGKGASATHLTSYRSPSSSERNQGLAVHPQAQAEQPGSPQQLSPLRGASFTNTLGSPVGSCGPGGYMLSISKKASATSFTPMMLDPAETQPEASPQQPTDPAALLTLPGTAQPRTPPTLRSSQSHQRLSGGGTMHSTVSIGASTHDPMSGGNHTTTYASPTQLLLPVGNTANGLKSPMVPVPDSGFADPPPLPSLGDTTNHVSPSPKSRPRGLSGRVRESPHDGERGVGVGIDPIHIAHNHNNVDDDGFARLASPKSPALGIRPVRSRSRGSAYSTGAASAADPGTETSASAWPAKTPPRTSQNLRRKSSQVQTPLGDTHPPTIDFLTCEPEIMETMSQSDDSDAGDREGDGRSGSEGDAGDGECGALIVSKFPSVSWNPESVDFTVNRKICLRCHEIPAISLVANNERRKLVHTKCCPLTQLRRHRRTALVTIALKLQHLDDEATPFTNNRLEAVLADFWAVGLWLDKTPHDFQEIACRFNHRKPADMAPDDESLEWLNFEFFSTSVTNVVEGSPIHECGLRKDDVLLSVEGCPILSDKVLVRVARETPPGEQMALCVKKVRQWSAVKYLCLEELKLLTLCLGEEVFGGALVGFVHGCRPIPLVTNGGYSLLLFSPTNSFRLMCYGAVKSPWFEKFILVCIFLSSMVMVVENPRHEQDEIAWYLEILNHTFTGIFVLEMLLKLVSFGLWIKPKKPLNSDPPYLRDKWNILDGMIVLVAVLSTVLNKYSFLKVLRTFRALRPLRVISRNRGLRMVVITLLRSIASIGNVVMITLIVFLVFGILGVQLFAGKLYSCTDPRVLARAACVGYFVDPESGDFARRRWVTSTFGNFDNLAFSMLTLFEVSTLELWTTIMYQSIDGRSHDLAPKRDANIVLALFFVLFVIVGSFFILNLFVGFVIFNFNKVKAEEDGTGYNSLTEEQKLWLETQTMMLNFKPVIRPHIPKSPLRRRVYAMVTAIQFDMFIAVCIALNTVLMMLDWGEEEGEWAMCLDIGNHVFSALFFIEAVMKIFAFGSTYIRDSWNRFDLALVILSIVQVILVIIDQGGIGVKGYVLRVLRVFRVLRVLRLVKSARDVRILLETVAYSLPHIANIGAFLCLLFFIYAVLGVNMFAKVKRNVYLNAHANFESFPRALLLLIRIVTGENWNGVMHETMVSEPDCKSELDNCGTSLAPLYYLSFLILATFILTNLFVAIVLDTFRTTILIEKSNLRMQDLHKFIENWAQFDPEATCRMRTSDLPFLLEVLGPPLGIKSHDSRLDILIRTKSYCIPEHGGVIHFIETLIPLARQVLMGNIEMSYVDTRDQEESWRQAFPDINDLPLLRFRQRRVTVDQYFSSTYIKAAYRRTLAVRAFKGLLEQHHERRRLWQAINLPKAEEVDDDTGEAVKAEVTVSSPNRSSRGSKGSKLSSKKGDSSSPKSRGSGR